MSEEEGLYAAKELLNLSEEVYLSYNRLLNHFYKGNKNDYEEEINNLKKILLKEKKYYKKLDENITLYILNEFDDSEMLWSIENNLDKYLNITKLGLSFNEISYFRILNLLRDNYIISTRLSSFDDKEIMDYEIDEYNDKMLNNIIIENQLFNDFMSLFITNIDTYIKNTDDFELKKNLNIYKYIIVFTYGKNNLELLNNNTNYIYSKYIYDMFKYAEKEFSYNYDIMKTHYLDRALYSYLKDYEKSNDKLEVIINKCFMKSIIMLYQEDYKRANKIYESVVTKEDNEIDTIVKNSNIIARGAKTLTLNK